MYPRVKGFGLSLKRASVKTACKANPTKGRPAVHRSPKLREHLPLDPREIYSTPKKSSLLDARKLIATHPDPLFATLPGPVHGS
jgi:hypothetical protein